MRDLEDTVAWEEHLEVMHARVPRRDPAAEAQIADARGPEETPLTDEDRANLVMLDRAAEVLADHPRQRYAPLDPANMPPGAVLLTGDEAAHYLTLKAASKRALETQNAHANAGAELREAIQALCKAMAPG